ncbi:DNA mismatch repair protein MutS [Halalkalibacillus sediminis]|uniref:DNA mismatch repair protein MutS n=1 Tax=Halalkalibacillus sediminis TaxID=2018042 RepID=A0A2I0QWJ4_9BACI|nr:DNA mismatch repair protein MutS [Halalkalibacillus sediminis]PKR78695.1 DNA mismatch repair protein MutS [Halalkalibacillus sediminis]
MAEYTPMIKQYLKIKDENQDAFLFFRMGDFYELFFDDALKAAKELEITLTQRDGGAKKIPMCGVPYHSAENYIKKLIEKGYKVAICEQVEDPKVAKGVVKREVVQVVTPGTIMEGSMLNEDENNFLASITYEDDIYAVSYVDLSTGESSVSQVSGTWKDVLSELYNRPVKEVVIASDFDDSWKESLVHYLNVTISEEDDCSLPEEFSYLIEKLEQPVLIKGFSRLFQYIYRSQKRFLSHLQQAEYVELEQYMKLDLYSKRNLELMESIRDKSRQGTLLEVLDRTSTAMGARRLKKWIDRPLLSQSSIERRHKQVQALMDHFFEREELKESLKDVYDLERLAGRISYGNVNARDLLQLKKSLKVLPSIRETLLQVDEPTIQELLEDIQPYKEVYELLDTSVSEDPPILITEGDIIKDGYNSQLDEYREASRNGRTWVANLEAQERERTGIKSLKIGFNKVFGYYIEVTKSHLNNVNLERFERKQTLANAERFITDELKEKEQLILEAKDKSVALEYELFVEIRDRMKAYIPALQLLAEQISNIDVLLSFANVSEENDYTRPSMNRNKQLIIEQGRHPVVEQVMKEEFVPNDIRMDERTNVLLITGPNMAGKSTYMRQVGLTAIMAQIGCFVPASVADLSVFDQIFTRIGAADDLVSGQSTFMVEMLEAEHAVRNATDESLILLDEIGRGTSTYDGMALAQSIVEYIHHEVKAKTLFSTHYHELTTLEDSLDHLENVHVEVDERDGEVVFLHHIKKGKADKSYGIHVAKLADLPDEIIDRAYHLLHTFETTNTIRESHSSDEEQLTLFEGTPEMSWTKEIEAMDELKNKNLMQMTPMDAMNFLYEIQKKLT